MKTLNEINQSWVDEIKRDPVKTFNKINQPQNDENEIKKEPMRTLDEVNQVWADEINKKPHEEKNKSECEIHKEEAGAERVARAPPLLKDMMFLVLKIVSISFVFIMLFTFLFGLVRYQEPYMNPAIKDGDLVIYYRYTKSGYTPKDTVVLEINGKQQVRRVIATAGDTVDITEDGLLINGALQQEPDIYQRTERYQEGVDFPMTVPEGQIFVLGDSRTGATDSRVYGSVKIEDTLGKVMTVIRRRSF